MLRVIRTAVIFGSVLALAACGGGDDSQDAGDTGSGDPTASVSMVDNAFRPVNLSVAAGSELSVANNGEALHNITIEGTSVDEDVDPGETTSVAMDLAPGEYTMVCEFHRQAGMEGTVTVQ